MTKTETTFGPDDPRDWNASHPMLKSPLAPHETGAVLRMQKAGWPLQEIKKSLDMVGSSVSNELGKAIADEAAAKFRGVDICEAVLTAEDLTPNEQGE